MIKYFLAPLLLLMFIIYASEAKANRDTHNHDINKPNISTNDVFALNEAPDDHVLGSNKAPITFIVWVSVTCPHCSDWFSNEWPVFDKMLVQTGKVRFIFRELPTQPAQLAMLGFMMAECAPSEKYFDLIKFQMQNQKEMFEMASKGDALSYYKKIGKMSGLNDDNDIRKLVRVGCRVQGYICCSSLLKTCMPACMLLSSWVVSNRVCCSWKPLAEAPLLGVRKHPQAPK